MGPNELFHLGCLSLGQQVQPFDVEAEPPGGSHQRRAVAHRLNATVSFQGVHGGVDGAGGQAGRPGQLPPVQKGHGRQAAQQDRDTP